MAAENKELKETIRRQVRETRRRIDPVKVQAASASIAGKVLKLGEFVRASKVGCYMALPHEVQMYRVIETCWAQGKAVGVPVYDRNRKDYGFAWYRQGEATGFGPEKIPQPLTIHPAVVSELDFVLVPAVAFDPGGRRLGHGGGYYDRLLKGYSGFKVGVAFEFQMVDAVPLEAHDVDVDLVITEKRICVPRAPGNNLAGK